MALVSTVPNASGSTDGTGTLELGGTAVNTTAINAVLSGTLVLNKAANNAAITTAPTIWIGDGDYGQGNAQVVYGAKPR